MSMSATPFGATDHVNDAQVIDGDAVSELARWIAQQIFKGCTRLELAQNDGKEMHGVEEWSIAEKHDPAALAQVIYTTAAREAQALQDSVPYGVFAFRPERRDWVARHMFRIDAATSWSRPRNTGDERGVLGLAIQHTDDFARLSLGHSRAVWDQYERLIDQSNGQHARSLAYAQKRIEILEARELEALELRDQLQRAAREHNLEILKVQEKAKLQTAALTALGKNAPALMSMLGFSGKTAASSEASTPADAALGASTPGDHALDVFVQSITPDQYPQLASILRPEQFEMLSDLYTVVEARIRRRTAAQAEATAAAQAQAAETKAASAAPPSASPPPSSPPGATAPHSSNQTTTSTPEGSPS